MTATRAGLVVIETSRTARGYQCSLDLLQCSALQSDIGVLVDLLSGHDVRVTQDELCLARLDTEAFEQRGGGVPGVMHGNARKLGLGADVVEAANEVLGIDRSPIAGGENEERIRGGCRQVNRLEVDPVEGSAPHQGCSDLGQHRDRSSTRVCLDWSGEEDSLDALELLSDVDDIRVEVDVTPPHSEHFASTHSVEQEKQVADFPAVSAGGSDELTRLFDVPGVDGLPLVLGKVDESGDIAEDEFLTHSPVITVKPEELDVRTAGVRLRCLLALLISRIISAEWFTGIST